MYDLQLIMPEIIYEEATLPVSIVYVHSTKEQVLVGDNITIQEPPAGPPAHQAKPPLKTVRFQDEPVVISIVPHQRVLPTKREAPLALLAIEDAFGTSYDDIPYDIKLATSAEAKPPLALETKPELEPSQGHKHWKRIVKLYYIIFFTMPFILVAIVQPWNV
jgi:hypothetical protein